MCTDELKRRLPIDYKGVRCLAYDHTAFILGNILINLGPGQGGYQGWCGGSRLR